MPKNFKNILFQILGLTLQVNKACERYVHQNIVLTQTLYDLNLIILSNVCGEHKQSELIRTIHELCSMLVKDAGVVNELENILIEVELTSNMKMVA